MPGTFLQFSDKTQNFHYQNSEKKRVIFEILPKTSKDSPKRHRVERRAKEPFHKRYCKHLKYTLGICWRIIENVDWQYLKKFRQSVRICLDFVRTIEHFDLSPDIQYFICETVAVGKQNLVQFIISYVVTANICMYNYNRIRACIVN